MAYDEKELEKLVSLVLTAACTMVVTVAPVFADAASTPAYSPVEASTVDSLLSSSVQWVGQSLMTYSDDDLANMEASTSSSMQEQLRHGKRQRLTSER